MNLLDIDNENFFNIGMALINFLAHNYNGMSDIKYEMLCKMEYSNCIDRMNEIDKKYYDNINENNFEKVYDNYMNFMKERGFI
jgi:hypothetical protein